MEEWLAIVVVLVIFVIFSMVFYVKEPIENVFIEFSYFDPVTEKIRHMGNLVPGSRRDIIKQIAVPNGILEIRSDIPIKLVGPGFEIYDCYFDLRTMRIEHSKLKLLI